MTDTDSEREKEKPRQVGFDISDDDRFEMIVEMQEEQKGRELTEEELDGLRTRLSRVMNL